MANRLIKTAFVLLVGGTALVVLLPKRAPPKAAAITAVTPLSPNEIEQPKATLQTVRVVYPSPETSEPNGVNSAVVSISPITKVDTVPTAGSKPVVESTSASDAKGEVPKPETLASAAPTTSTQPLASKQVVNINSASIEAMNHLAGAGRIGLSIARHRPYHSVEDLLIKHVVRRSVYDRVRLQVAVK